MNKVDLVERARLRKDIPPFRPGDQVKVHVKVSEGGRERIQVFEGVVLARRGGGLRESFKVRKISFGVGVERTFPLHSPSVSKIEVVRHGKVRRAKLYYLRERTGRHAKIEERRTRIQEWTPEADVEPEAPPAEETEAAESAPEAEATVDEAGAAEVPTEEPEAAEPASTEAPAAEEPKQEQAAEPAEADEQK